MENTLFFTIFTVIDPYKLNLNLILQGEKS